MQQIFWQKCQGDVWGSFHLVDLNHFHFDKMEGVYVIWQGSGPIIRVGQGNIRDRLIDHRTNPEIYQHNNLYVTWAPVLSHLRDGVERYLAEALTPVVGDAFPRAIPIPVNLPW